MVEVEAARSVILRNYASWKSQKSEFYPSVDEFEAEEVAPHLNEEESVFIDRVSGKIMRRLEMHGSNVDFALFTDILIVVISAELVTPVSTFEDDEKRACSELWFDPAVEVTKTRVVCIVLQRKHFQFGVVRCPQVRAIFSRGDDWNAARHLILSFIKSRPADEPLGPQWELEPAGKAS
jgi:hypothetical protein